MFSFDGSLFLSVFIWNTTIISYCFFFFYCSEMKRSSTYLLISNIFHIKAWAHSKGKVTEWACVCGCFAKTPKDLTYVLLLLSLAGLHLTALILILTLLYIIFLAPYARPKNNYSFPSIRLKSCLPYYLYIVCRFVYMYVYIQPATMPLQGEFSAVFQKKVNITGRVEHKAKLSQMMHTQCKNTTR